MERSEILRELQQVLENEFDIEPDIVVPEALLYDDLDIDSIDAVDLLAWMYKLTGKRMEPEKFRNVRTVEDVIAELELQLSSKSSSDTTASSAPSSQQPAPEESSSQRPVSSEHLSNGQ